MKSVPLQYHEALQNFSLHLKTTIFSNSSRWAISLSRKILCEIPCSLHNSLIRHSPFNPSSWQLRLPIISSFTSHAILLSFGVAQEHSTQVTSNPDGAGWALTFHSLELVGRRITGSTPIRPCFRCSFHFTPSSLFREKCYPFLQTLQTIFPQLNTILLAARQKRSRLDRRSVTATWNPL